MRAESWPQTRCRSDARGATSLKRIWVASLTEALNHRLRSGFHQAKPYRRAVSIDGFGILHVDAGARLAQADIRICVSQLNAVNDSCQNIGVNQTPTITPALTPGGGNAGDLVVPLAVAGGAGVGGYYLLNQYMPGFGFLGGSCSPADPTPAQVCFGGNSGSVGVPVGPVAAEFVLSMRRLQRI